MDHYIVFIYSHRLSSIKPSSIIFTATTMLSLHLSKEKSTSRCLGWMNEEGEVWTNCNGNERAGSGWDIVINHITTSKKLLGEQEKKGRKAGALQPCCPIRDHTQRTPRPQQICIIPNPGQRKSYKTEPLIFVLD